MRLDDRRYTYRDYASWSEGERWELIYGVAYSMIPAASTSFAATAFTAPVGGERGRIVLRCVLVRRPTGTAARHPHSPRFLVPGRIRTSIAGASVHAVALPTKRSKGGAALTCDRSTDSFISRRRSRESTVKDRGRKKTVKRQYAAPAVDRALDILEFMAKHPHPYGATELSRLLRIPINSVFRILKRLTDRQYTVQDPLSDGYQLSTKMFSLGMSLYTRFELLQRARPHLEWLCRCKFPLFGKRESRNPVRVSPAFWIKNAAF